MNNTSETNDGSGLDSLADALLQESGMDSDNAAKVILQTLYDLNDEEINKVLDFIKNLRSL